MPRPTLHSSDDLLDAAAGLIAAGGPAGVSMASVAKAAGAPSGSLYHRFPSRGALLGGLWLRTVTRFQAGFVAALAAQDPHAACAAAARHVVRWSRRHPGEAGLLLRGPEDFGPAEWPEETRARVAAARRDLEAALKRVEGDLDRVVLVTVDIPYAVVRRHLRRGPVPRSAESLVADAVGALL